MALHCAVSWFVKVVTVWPHASSIALIFYAIPDMVIDACYFNDDSMPSVFSAFLSTAVIYSWASLMYLLLSLTCSAML
jgi:hypothetical protein